MSVKIALEQIAREKQEKTGSLSFIGLGLIEIPKEILELKHLTSLNLHFNKISDYSFLEKLTNLTSLDLRSNKISDYSFLEKLTNLTSLDLRSNQISDISFLEKLTNLTSLNLSLNKISDISFLQNLTNLTTLDLCNNQISEIRNLEKLTKLKILNIGTNQLKEISNLEKLTNLIDLSLHNNDLTEINNLDNQVSILNKLTLSFNHIKDISYLKKFTKLTELVLDDNNISNIQYLEHLTNLNKLYLSQNNILNYQPLKKLSNLTVLHLSSNRISNIQYLENLTNLRDLVLYDNQISDISLLEKLTKLTSLYLDNNQISNIKPLLALIKVNETKVTLEEEYGGYLRLGNNPITNPPIETVAKGNEAIIKYFEDLETQGKDYLYEAKLLIVGEGESGKTTLAWKIKDIDAKMPSKENDRTKGIDIQSLAIENRRKGEKPFKMNIWDFGGQEIYHATHQFFLTKRSLYVIVNNTRSNLTDFNHWVQTINLFSDNSPIIIVQNEVAGSPTDFDLRGLQGKFKNVLFVKDADLSNIKNGKIQRLIQTIQDQIQTLDHIGIELPAKWVSIRADLEKVAKEKPYIKLGDFEQICADNKITDKDAIERLGDLLHDLGVMLHFRTDKVLKHWVILQNTWATKGVYAILDAPKVKTSKGHFSYRTAKSIWKNTVFEGMHDELLQLMDKFELCYELSYKKGHYVSPQLLPIEKPIYDWNDDKNLLIYYDYEFMPKGLLARLIVRLHRYIKNVDTMAWRTGCVFTHQATDAQVIETYGSKKIEIRIKGKHCTDLTAIIVKEIDELNAEFKQLKVDKLIPCNCSHCKSSNDNEPYFYKYQELKERLGNGKMSVDFCKYNNYQSIDIRTLLNETIGQVAMEQDKDRSKRNITVYGGNVNISENTEKQEIVNVPEKAEAQEQNQQLNLFYLNQKSKNRSTSLKILYSKV